MRIEKDHILGFEQRYRTTFVNSLAGFRTAVLVGTVSDGGMTNLALFNSLIHIGAHPPLYGLLFRPDSVRRHTLENILSTRAYTLNYVAAAEVEKAHQTSARYPADVSEFAAVGFTEEQQEGFAAPFVREAVVKIGMSFTQRVDVPINGTILIVGSVERIELDDRLVGADGFVSLEGADVLVCAGLDAYYRASTVGRYAYAKPDCRPGRID